MIWPFTKPVDKTAPVPAPDGFKWYAFDLDETRPARHRRVPVGSLELWSDGCAPVTASYHRTVCTVPEHRRDCTPYGKKDFDLVARYDVREASLIVLKQWRRRMELEHARENVENWTERWNRR